MSPPSVPPQAPSARSTASLRRVPWGEFPDLFGTISRLRLLASPRASLRLLRSALPPLRPSSLPSGWDDSRGPGPLLSRRPRRLSTVEKARPPRFLDDPCVHAPLSDPGGAPTTGLFVAGAGAFRVCHRVGSANECVSGLYHAACTLPVDASQPRSPSDHAPLGSGWGPALAGRDSHPPGRTEGFRHVYPSTWLPPSPGFVWRTANVVELFDIRSAVENSSSSAARTASRKFDGDVTGHASARTIASRATRSMYPPTSSCA